MKITQEVLLRLTVVLVLVTFLVPITPVFADKQGDIADYRRKVDAQILDLQEKIKETREDYHEDGKRVNQRIREYEDRINELKREKDVKVENMDEGYSNRITSVRKDFHEWRLKRAINSYDDKIEDVRRKAINEADADKRRDLDEKIAKLEVKYNAARSKLNDLRMTNGENWDKIEAELNASVKEIDADYENAYR